MIDTPGYVGCYKNTYDKVLPVIVDLTGYYGYNSLYYCQQVALANNAYYFGLELGSICYYGPQTSNLVLNAAVYADSDCNFNCFGNSATAPVLGPSCGAKWRISVYKTQVN